MTSQLKITGLERIKRKEEDVGIDDQLTEVCNVGDHLASQESETRSNNIILNLPDIPFNVLAMTLSITQLRALTQVSSSLKKRITENILENQARKNDLRVRIKKVIEQRILDFSTVKDPFLEQYPSNEDISNAMWLSKYYLLSCFSF